jgi:hypothetical protein
MIRRNSNSHAKVALSALLAAAGGWPTPPPSDAEVARVAGRVQRSVARLVERRGLGPRVDPEESDTLQRDQPLLAELYGASISGRAATGPRAGRCVAKVGDAVDWEDLAQW